MKDSCTVIVAKAWLHIIFLTHRPTILCELSCTIVARAFLQANFGTSTMSPRRIGTIRGDVVAGRVRSRGARGFNEGAVNTRPDTRQPNTLKTLTRGITTAKNRVNLILTITMNRRIGGARGCARHGTPSITVGRWAGDPGPLGPPGGPVALGLPGEAG